jgi:hypothetical protein
MAITYTFLTDNTMKLEIAPELNGLEKVITRVRYNYVGADENGNEGTFSGVTPMPAPNTESYKPFSELTPEDIVSWLEATADVAHMQERIAKEIQSKIAPKYVETTSPWATVEEEVVEPVVEPVVTE